MRKTKMVEKIKIKISELPKYLELKGEKGQKKLYKIMPAGRKFGAHLNSVDFYEEELLRKDF